MRDRETERQTETETERQTETETERHTHTHIKTDQNDTTQGKLMSIYNDENLQLGMMKSPISTTQFFFYLCFHLQNGASKLL